MRKSSKDEFTLKTSDREDFYDKMSSEQHLMFDFNSKENVLDSFGGNILFTLLQVTINFGHRGFNAFKDNIYFLHFVCFANGFSCFDVPVIGFDFDFCTELYGLTVDGNPSHNRHVSVGLLAIPFEVKKDAECSFHIPNFNVAKLLATC